MFSAARIQVPQPFKLAVYLHKDLRHTPKYGRVTQAPGEWVVLNGLTLICERPNCRLLFLVNALNSSQITDI